MKIEHPITQKCLRDILRYEPETGLFFWRAGLRAGLRVGTKSVRGAIVIGIGGRGGRIYYAHRLAWLYMHGYWPALIDHKNLDQTDNRISNLREASVSQNNFNAPARKRNRLGLKGVSFNTKRQKWAAHIQWQRKQKNLGLYDNPEDAKAAYDKAAHELGGEFART